ncbi:MAG: aminotransferase class V-fold PLP-dependent enzyme, partial [Caldiserica bacterium]|nr:aminotransferase class V-fold PLP-dependent enzyme [Caldisericota bacterium]
MRDVRADFPVLEREVNGRPLVYLDSAATSQKPRHVIEAETRFYREANANVHRGLYALSVRATELYEGARRKVAAFIGAAPEEVIFTRGTTESLNALAHSLAEARVGAGDEILVTVMEHHANLVPWQLAARRKRARLVAVGITPEGKLDLDDFKGKLSSRTRIVAVTHVSNVLGTV